MAEVKSNENEFKSQVTSWLSSLLSKGNYPFHDVSSDPSVKGKQTRTKFPDIQIWLNRKAKLGFCGWELKTPITAVDDAELLENAADKARVMNADYFVTWNMRESVIWRTPQKGEAVSAIHRFKSYQSIHQVNVPDDLWDTAKQKLLKSRAKEILDDLAVLHKEGHLNLVDADSTFFVHKLHEAVNTLGPYVHQSLRARIARSPKFKEGLFIWAVKQGIARYDAGEMFFETVSRQILYRLLGKIVFYLTLRRFRKDIPKLDFQGIDISKISEKLQEYFEAARRVDYQAVFERDFADDVSISRDAAEALARLVTDLNRYNFSEMPQDVIGHVFEKLIPLEERHTLGQYFTSENLVDLIVAFCVRSAGDNVLDPTCGTGTFLIRAYDRLRSLGNTDHKRLLSQIWGIDIAHFPAELATINLYRQDIADYANFPRVTVSDFFDVKLNHSLEFPLPKPGGADSSKIRAYLPEFDSIVGNFPYIRQELIEKRVKGYKGKIARVLADEWREEYPDIFTNGDMKLSGQADIYAYLFFHAAKHLKEFGRLGIVTSNSWLDVAYGYELQRFFLKHFKLVAIIESRCEPWFEDAAVNTIVTILERCTTKEERANNFTKFVKIKKPLSVLMPWDLKSSSDRWFGIDKLVYDVENADSLHGSQGDQESKFDTNGYIGCDSENFTIRVVNQGTLLREVEESGKTIKWGRYLRAPDVYFEILKMCKDSLVSLSDVADIRRGYTTGVNEFFYLDDEKTSHWFIENEYLAPVIKSPREATRIFLKSEQVKFKVFLCRDSKTDLRKKGKHGAYEYIKWGEKQTTRDGRPWSEVPTVLGRKYWYDLGEKKPGTILLQMITGDRYFAVYNADCVYVDHNLFELFPIEDDCTKGLLTYLNSSVFALFRELISRVNLGEGATKTEGIDWKDILAPRPEIIKTLEMPKKLEDSFKNRDIESIFEEVKKRDRQELDALVLKALGLDPSKYLQPLYDGLTGLVRERLDLAQSRKKIKQVKVLRDVERLKEQAIEEIIPHGLKRFPEEFLDSKYLQEFEEMSIPGLPLRLGDHFMGRQEVVADSGSRMDMETPELAKFVVYAQKPDSYLIRVPKNRPALSKAVRAYEQYLSELESGICKTLYSRTLDHKLAKSVAQEIVGGFVMWRR